MGKLVQVHPLQSYLLINSTHQVGLKDSCHHKLPIFCKYFIMYTYLTHQFVINFVTVICLRIGNSLGWNIYKAQNYTSYMVC